MIHHFKQVMEGPRPPIGEAYVAVESPKGEKGYYMVSDGIVEAGALAHSSAVVREPLGDSEDGRRASAVGRHRDQRVDRHRDGRDRPMSSASTPEYFRAPADWGPSDGKGFETDQRPRPSRARAVRAGVHRGQRARKELDELLTRYPTKMAALLPALWMVQHERGWVSDEGMAEVAAAARAHAGVREGRGHVLHDVPPASGRRSTSSRSARRRRATSAAPRRSSTRSCEHTGCQELGADVARRQVSP